VAICGVGALDVQPGSMEARPPVGTDRHRVGVAILFLASGTVLFVTAFLVVEGWSRWLLMAIFGLPGAFALWLGVETFKRQLTASSDDEMDDRNSDER
jgi:hypothetical protein